MNTDTHFSNLTNEWYTPPELVDRVVRTLGYIDIDPCSPPTPTIPCKMYYTKWSDGLSQVWSGNVYMNPPYGREVALWVDKLTTEIRAGHVDEAIVLTAARPDTKWFQKMARVAHAWCAIRGRLKFSGSKNSAPFPSAVFLYAKYQQTYERFIDDFEEIGMIFTTPPEAHSSRQKEDQHHE